MVAAIFVLEGDGVIVQTESGIFVRSAEVDRERERLDRVVVVVELQVLDEAVAILDDPVDADADAGLGLEDESSAHGDNLGDLHDEDRLYGTLSVLAIVDGVGCDLRESERCCDDGFI